ncbi:MAG: septal ring lytic transglycosylase RlpA family protein [Burkholderiales bacterium]|nr:septal ring lytic transglycosylase RlpA family protein [Burkholderiales bacterium]
MTVDRNRPFRPASRLVVGIALAISGCATAPPPLTPPAIDPQVTHESPAPRTQKGGGYYKDDGPAAKPPSNLDSIPDAQPKAEALHRYANRPYTVFGKNYVPATSRVPYKARGIASWYGKKFHGERTSSGETYNMYAMTAAHPTLPIPSYVRVTRRSNNNSVVVRVNDRGPFHGNRLIDLSYTAAYKLGYLDDGSTPVEVELILPDETRAIAKASDTGTVPQTSTDVSVPTARNNSLSRKVGPSAPIYLQLGAFATRAKADELLARLRIKFGGMGALGDALQIFLKDGLYRVHAGPYSSRDSALVAAGKIKSSAAITPLLTVR